MYSESGINNPTIKKADDYKDKEGLLTKGILEKDTDDVVYTASDKTKYLKFNIRVVNTGTATAKLTIYISSLSKINTVPKLEDVIEWQIELEPNGVYVGNNLRMDSKESIVMRTDKDNLVVRIEGYDNRM